MQVTKRVLFGALLPGLLMAHSGMMLHAADATDTEAQAREEKFAALITQLKDGNPPTRALAAIGLGKLGDKRAVVHLIASTRDEHRGVRLSAIVVSGELSPWG